MPTKQLTVLNNKIFTKPQLLTIRRFTTTMVNISIFNAASLCPIWRFLKAKLWNKLIVWTNLTSKRAINVDLRRAITSRNQPPFRTSCNELEKLANCCPQLLPLTVFNKTQWDMTPCRAQKKTLSRWQITKIDPLHQCNHKKKISNTCLVKNLPRFKISTRLDKYLISWTCSRVTKRNLHQLCRPLSCKSFPRWLKTQLPSRK